MILAGGYGSRISDVDQNIPKPMIRLDDKPIIEHIINIYKSYNLKKFILLTGYKNLEIKKFFTKNSKNFSDCEIEIFNTGIHTLTGSRILKAKKFITEDNFMVTYGDGLSDINIDKLIKFHKKSKTTFHYAMLPPFSLSTHLLLAIFVCFPLISLQPFL